LKELDTPWPDGQVDDVPPTLLILPVLETAYRTDPSLAIATLDIPPLEIWVTAEARTVATADEADVEDTVDVDRTLPVEQLIVYRATDVGTSSNPDGSETTPVDVMVSVPNVEVRVVVHMISPELIFMATIVPL
jgi:hypothetical protein